MLYLVLENSEKNRRSLMKKLTTFLMVVALTLGLVTVGLTHSGRTDRNGCHTDSRTGVQH